ncbi:hypothetical protein KCU78_g3065, partial [Aureobasidium melanogenum]
MPGSHDLSVENLRLHERIVEEEKQSKRVVKTATSAPTAKHSARPPAKPATVVTSQVGSKAGSKAGSKIGSKAESKTGSKHETSHHNKEVLVVTVIEEGDEEEGEENSPPKAPSLASKHHNSKKPPSSANPPASKVSSHHNRNWDLYHIPAGIPLPPGFSKVSEFAALPNFDVKEYNDMALVRLPSLPAARSITSGAALPEKQVAKRYPASSHVSSSHHSKISSHHTKTKVLEDGGGGADFGDVVFEEVREVTKRRYVIKMPADKIVEWRY